MRASPSQFSKDDGCHSATKRPASLREEFRARVLSGLLLHLCPPSGQFADLFGVEEGLRWRILGMLGARDLATFGLVREQILGRRGKGSLLPVGTQRLCEREGEETMFVCVLVVCAAFVSFCLQHTNGHFLRTQRRGGGGGGRMTARWMPIGSLRDI